MDTSKEEAVPCYLRFALFAAVVYLAACDGSPVVINRDDLVSVAQAVPEGYCCQIPQGQTTQPIGSIQVDPADRELSSLGFETHLALAIDEVTPPGVLEFRWDGPFVADDHLFDNPNSVPTLFDPRIDVGGFRGQQTLSFAAKSCAFQRVSFVVVVIEYERASGEDDGGLFSISPFLGPYRKVARQRHRVEVVNCEEQPEPPPAEDRIVFSRTLSGQPGEIWTGDRDGNETRLTNDAFSDLDPAWSPDRGAIAFASNRGNPLSYEIYTMDADGTDIAPMTAFGTRWVYDPAWAPNGHEIAMTVGQPGQPDTDVWIVDLDLPLGPANPRQLTTGIGQDRSPTWSPDGLRIAFVRNGDVLVMPVDGSAGPSTVIEDMDAVSVDWSSQDQLAFDRYETLFIAYRVWKAGSNGQNPVRVNDGAVGLSDTSPSWSRDATLIAFVRGEAFAEEPARRIHVMGADGQDPQPIGTQPGDNNDPDW
ncbi:MAG: TolB family protein [Planctomycetota bacterium]